MERDSGPVVDAANPAGRPLGRYLAFIVLSLPIIYLLLFFFYPLLEIFRVSLFPDGELQGAGFRALVSRPYYREVLGFTVGQALLSTGLTLLVGLPAARVFARYGFRGKSVLRALLTVPFVMPTVVVATAFLALLGERGRVNLWLMEGLNLSAPPLQMEGGLAIILLAHVFYNLAVVVRLVGGFWADLDPRLEEAAAVLGASPRRVLTQVTLPLLAPSIAAATLLIFLFTFSSFGVVLILGGLRYATIEVEIYRQTVSLFNLPLAAALSLLQMGFTLLLMTLYTRLQARSAVVLASRGRRRSERPVRGWRTRLGVLVALGVPLLLVAAPLLALVERSLTLGGEPTLRYYLALGEIERRSVFAAAPGLAIRNSLLVALATTVLSLTLGTLSAYLLASPGRRGGGGWRALLDPLFLLPLGTSAVTLGFGYLIALDEPPLNLRTSVLLLPLAHGLIAFPFVVRSLLPALRALDPALREAAATLGAAPLARLREIDLPLLWRPMLVGAVFAFAISIGEFGATSLIQRPEWPTMPVLIFRFLGRPGLDNYGRALAMSVVLMSTTALGFLLIERFRVGDGSEF